MVLSAERGKIATQCCSENERIPVPLSPLRQRLWAEFLGLFVIAPVAIAVLVPARFMFALLFVFMAVGLALLHRTQEFAWADLARLRPGIPPRMVVGFTAGTAFVAYGLVQLSAPEVLFSLPRQRPDLWLMIMLLYPVLSALPQEIVFRPLFFCRYGTLLPDGWAGVVLNAALFSLAHLMYWSWTVALMTFAGGLVFAWAYRLRGSFTMALLLHAIAGNLIFTFGLGLFFYSGNVTRPF